MMTASGRKEDATERKGRQISTKPREAPVISKGWTFRLECYGKRRETPQSELRNTILVKCVKQNNSPAAWGTGHKTQPRATGVADYALTEVWLASFPTFMNCWLEQLFVRH